MSKTTVYKKIYQVLAFTTFNTIILITIINLFLAAAFVMRDFHSTQPDLGITIYREKFTDLQAYVRISAEVANDYLDQQDIMGTKGFEFEPWVQFRHRQFHGSLLQTNEMGFRRTKEPQSRKGTPVKIYVFGGSTTFGYGVPDHHTIPSYMQTILEDRHPSKPILVRNFGQGFYYSSQEMLLLISLIKTGDIPDLAVFIDGGNDTAQLLPKRDEPVFTPILNELWSRRSALPSDQKREWSWIPMVRLAKGLAGRILPPNLDSNGEVMRDHGYTASAHRLIRSDRDLVPETKKGMIEYVISRYTNNMRIIRSICKEYGVRCMFVWQPHVVYKYDRSLHKKFPFEGSVPDVYVDVYSRMEQFKSDDFLYLGNMLDGVREKVFVDDVHYNEATNEEIARRISYSLGID